MNVERSHLKTRLARVSDQGKEDDLRATSPGQRLGMLWPLTLSVWAFRERLSAEPRLQRHVVSLQRREG